MRNKTLSLCAILFLVATGAAYAQNPFDNAVKNIGGTKTVTTKPVAERTMQHGHQCADLGLSVLWATSNIDAANSRGYYGRIVAWGELKEKDLYTESNSVNSGKARQNISGDVNFDVAAYLWKHGWRMPTRSEMQELRDKCVWTWATESGRKGYKIVSKINGNYIFLPAVGINRRDRITEMNMRGYYWTATPDNNNKSAYCLSFDDEGINLLQGLRYEGCYIRPVRNR